MCDYSLRHLASRPARVGDDIVTTGFPNSFTRGFATAGEPNMVVCLMPGTELRFEKPVKCEGRFFFFRRKLDQTLARFRHVDEDRPDVHHDALEFANGEIVRLTKLCEGQRATVLQLPAEPRHEAHEHTPSLPARVEGTEAPRVAPATPDVV